MRSPKRVAVGSEQVVHPEWRDREIQPTQRCYLEHFVFSLHVHEFGFTLKTVALLFEGAPVPALLFGWLVLYCRSPCTVYGTDGSRPSSSRSFRA